MGRDEDVLPASAIVVYPASLWAIVGQQSTLVRPLLRRPGRSVVPLLKPTPRKKTVRTSFVEHNLKALALTLMLMSRNSRNACSNDDRR